MIGLMSDRCRYELYVILGKLIIIIWRMCMRVCVCKIY